MYIQHQHIYWFSEEEKGTFIDIFTEFVVLQVDYEVSVMFDESMFLKALSMCLSVPAQISLSHKDKITPVWISNVLETISILHWRYLSV